MAKKKEKMELVSPGADLLETEPSESLARRFFYTPMPRWDLRFPNRFPRVDMEDEGKFIRVKADLPGVEKNDVKLNVDKTSITISASASREQERKGKNYYYRERSSSGYYRSIPLPVEVDAASAKAKFSNGTLEVMVDKKNPSSKPVKIE